MSGVIIDVHHPQRGQAIPGKVLAMPGTRGSGSNAQIFAELARNAATPAAVVLTRPDDVLLAGAVVGSELYGVAFPVGVADPAHLPKFAYAVAARVDIQGKEGRAVLSASGQIEEPERERAKSR